MGSGDAREAASPVTSTASVIAMTATWSPSMNIGINIALGNVEASTCSQFDLDHNDMVTVDELLGAVNAALIGCLPLA